MIKNPLVGAVQLGEYEEIENTNDYVVISLVKVNEVDVWKVKNDGMYQRSQIDDSWLP